MALAKSNDLPDLDNLKLNSGRFAMKGFMLGGMPPKRSDHGLTMHLVRLADLAVASYRSARASLDEWHNAGQNIIPIGAVMAAIGHFENCVWALERGIKIIAAVRSSKSAPQSLKNAIIPKTNPKTKLRILSSGATGAITQLRNAIAHVDEDLDKIPNESWMSLFPTPDGLKYGEHHIVYGDLAAWIREAHACATRVTNSIGTHLRK